MKRALLLLMIAAPLQAQSTTPSVQAQGSASIAVQPDQAQLTITISTTGATAQAAGQQNANINAAVTTALQSFGTIQTVSYTVSPQYSNGSTTQPPAVVGYVATINQQLTLTDLTKIGSAIDTANQAGATSVGNLTLGLQNPEPALESALTAASKQAMLHASAIASGLSGKTGPVISAQEATTYTPVLVGVVSGPGAATSIQTGPISVSATVTVTVQLQ